jgi:hypothetical protein
MAMIEAFPALIARKRRRLRQQAIVEEPCRIDLRLVECEIAFAACQPGLSNPDRLGKGVRHRDQPQKAQIIGRGRSCFLRVLHPALGNHRGRALQGFECALEPGDEGPSPLSAVLFDEGGDRWKKLRR